MKSFSELYIRSLLSKFGIEINRFRKSSLHRRFLLLEDHKINLIFDVGANTGLYGKALRLWGFQGKIISFEPLTSAFNKLQAHSKKDKLWIVNNYALGDKIGTETLNVSKNTQSSSILRISRTHLESCSESRVIGEETIKIKTVDSIIDEFFNSGDILFVKLDTQGYESKILKGSTRSFHKISGIQLELSLKEMYKGEKLLWEMAEEIKKLGFKLKSIEPGHFDQRNGELLQLDCIFFR